MSEQSQGPRPELQPLGPEVFNIDHLPIEAIKRMNRALWMEAIDYRENNDDYPGDTAHALSLGLSASIRGLCVRDPEKAKELLMSMQDDPNDPEGYQRAKAALCADALVGTDYAFARDLIAEINARPGDSDAIEVIYLVTGDFERLLMPEQVADFRQVCDEQIAQAQREGYRD